MKLQIPNPRIYGKSPYQIAVIHGGPGGGGEMAPIARELAPYGGILEPLQTKNSIHGQLDELKTLLDNNGTPPYTLIGSSWGAWLSYIFTAHNPNRVKKLILIGSGPFEQKYADGIQKTRLDRLTREEKGQFNELMTSFNHPDLKVNKIDMARLGELFSKTDSFAPIHDKGNSDAIEFNQDIYQKVWKQAADLRRNGQLLELGKKIICPVVAIHGDYDPHPAEGVQYPLAGVLKNFRFILLKNCGHTPWLEQEAKDIFYEILKEN